MKVDLARKAYLAGSRSRSRVAKDKIEMKGECQTLQCVAGTSKKLVEDVIATLSGLLTGNTGLLKKIYTSEA